LVALTALDSSDPDIVVSYGGVERPTYEQYDWVSANAGDDHLVIQREPNASILNKTYFAAKKINQTMQGEYVIGVTTKSVNGSLYKISYTTGEIKLFELIEGVPFLVQVKAKQSLYF
jgi:hypothetical protein